MNLEIKFNSPLFFWFRFMVPRMITFFVFLSGVILLSSNAFPEAPARLKWLENFISLPVVETSHFLTSIVGLGLILLARSLLRRLDSAYILTLIFLFLGIFFTLLKGLNYEEAILLGIIFITLMFFRKYFYRKGSLLTEPFTPGWVIMILVVIGCFVGLGFFSYKHIEYSHELWWKFELSGDAPRFLRASVGLFISILIIFWGKLLSPGVLKFIEPSVACMEKARTILRNSERSSANLILLKDKMLFLNNKENCFLMYRSKGRNWICLGDPVGPVDEWEEIIQQFRKFCDIYNGFAVFSEISKDYLSLYLDMGFSLIKMGEEARVHVPSFSLDIPIAKDLKRVIRKTEEKDFTFSVVFPEHGSNLWPQLKQISDSWLTVKKAKEKRFSLGFYDEKYLANFPLAIVSLKGEIFAFANMWLGANKKEFSIDLMRYSPKESPHGIMDYLFTKLILWGKTNGYEWFNMGMAPLSGIENQEFAPLWYKFENLIYEHGENFYNFKGLRSYKEKFNPVWESKYLAYPVSGSLPVIWADLLTITSGGLKGPIGKLK